MKGTINLRDYTHRTLALNGFMLLWRRDNCETCGEPVQAANALRVEANPRVVAEMDRAGIERVERADPEGWHDEETGMEVCDNCPAKDWCETNDCERSSCHRCFPRQDCIFHDKCREFSASGTAYTDEDAETMGTP